MRNGKPKTWKTGVSTGAAMFYLVAIRLSPGPLLVISRAITSSIGLKQLQLPISFRSFIGAIP